MTNPLTNKLEQFTAFTAPERQRLDALAAASHRTYAAREPILTEGEKVRHIHLVLRGLAARSKDLPDGARQIMAFLIPGDLCDVEVFVLDAMDHDIIALSDVTCALIPTHEMEGLLTESSNITRAMWWSTMTDAAVLRERIVDHGRRDARERLAHLFYELLIRHRAVGASTDNEFPLPITQHELADATGMTNVHVNRTLQQLRDDGLVEFRNRSLRVLDPARLKAVAGFNANYLHLRRAEEGDAVAARPTGDLL